MAAISSLFRRLGYLKLDDYGLLVTSDDRVLSTRTAVLDDGLGGKIVGWKEGDLAAMELASWEPRPPATARATAKPPAIPPPLPRAAIASPPAPAPASNPPAPVVAVAPMACEDEDEWEWEIAVARARAAAEWAEEAAAAIATSAMKPTAPVKPARPQRITASIAVVAAPKPDPLKADGPKTQEKAAPSKVDQVPRQPMQTGTNPIITSARPVPKPVLASGSAPTRTVIPVPALPRVTDPSTVRPVVSPRPPVRYVRATGRVDDTIRTYAAPANDDKTSPHIALPPSGAGKRVAAQQR